MKRVEIIRLPRRRPAPPKKEAEYLKRIQKELLPEHADEFVAINMETGEYVIGKSNADATRAFWRRWPDTFMYVCRVDGGPATKFHGM